MWCIWPLLLLGCCCGNRGCRDCDCRDCDECRGCRRRRRERDDDDVRSDLAFPRTNVYRCFDRRDCSTDCVLREKKDDCRR